MLNVSGSHFAGVQSEAIMHGAAQNWLLLLSTTQQ